VEELTITMMPPGDYKVVGKNIRKDYYWSLPPVRRFNHKDCIPPYNPDVAATYLFK